MTNKKGELVEKKEGLPVPLVTEQTIKDYLFGSETKLTEQQQKLFLGIALRYQLDPFKREIHAVPYFNSRTGKYDVSFVTGYEVYLKRAERQKQLDGWEVETEGNLKDGGLKARITIYRKDWSRPLRHEIFFSEYCQHTKDGTPTKFWKEKPITMLKKVVIEQGFRLAFPDELAGMPYGEEELGVETNQIQEKVEQPPAKLKEKEPVTEHHSELLSNILQSRYLKTEEGKKLLAKSANNWEAISDQEAREIITWWFGDAYNPGIRKKRELAAQKTEANKKELDKKLEEPKEPKKPPTTKKPIKIQIKEMIATAEKQGIPFREVERYCKEKLNVQKFEELDQEQLLLIKNWINTLGESPAGGKNEIR